MHLKQRLKTAQVLSLKQTLSPKVIQLLKTFQMPYAQLVKEIEQESEDNVFIDIVRYDDLHRSSKKQKSQGDAVDYALLSQVESKHTLKNHLLEQLSLDQLNNTDYAVCEHLIDSIDHQGYIKNYTEVKQTITSTLQVKDRKVGEMLKLIQTFEPEGVGARTLKECLLIQISQTQFDSQQLNDILHKVVSQHLDDIANDAFEKMATKLSISKEGAQNIADYIKTNLTPHPGAHFSSQDLDTVHVIPSFEVTLRDDKLVVKNLEKDAGILIKVSDKYLSMFEDPSIDTETKQFLKEKLSKARHLEEMLTKRHENLEKLVLFIVNHQSEFIRHGTLFLDPLQQRDIAIKLGISSSTVSRIVSSKYIQTPQGMFSLKSLCPRNHFGRTQARLKKTIHLMLEENPTFSDEKIRTLLKEKGIMIARRTITEYRISLGVFSSYYRNKDITKETQHRQSDP